MRQLTLAVLSALLMLACSQAQAPLSASDVVVTRSVPGMPMSAGYFKLTNNSGQAINISHVTSPQFASVQMHETIITDEVARMVSLEMLILQPGETVRFEPGGKHLMLMQPANDIDSVTLDFFAGESLLLSVNTDFDR
ncbi:MAG: copper chaperone PCu(A)C [Gammaproteobacteria bacterium]|nr:copper chaperone PCu(A)C [Gammaproteobacteria bacterium]MDH3417693.1 copper chaperone PCu(A)C [Gammaproteobacteria bacterium]